MTTETAAADTTITTTPAPMTTVIAANETGYFDIFPSNSIENVPEIRMYFDTNTYEIQKVQSFSFITVRINDCIQFFKIPQSQQMIESMVRCWKESKIRNYLSGTLNMVWNEVQVKLEKPIRNKNNFYYKINSNKRRNNSSSSGGGGCDSSSISSSNSNSSRRSNDDDFQRCNADVRMSFRWKNFFLTKANFTFGQRKAKKGHVHILKTTEAPILYNVAKEPFDQQVRRNYKESSFHAMDQYMYQCFVLQPNSIYIIPSDHVYILLTVQKTLFSLNKCKVSVAKEIRNNLNLTFKDPQKQKYLLLSMADRKALKDKITRKRKWNEEKEKKSCIQIRKIDEILEWPTIDVIKKPKFKRGRPRKEIIETKTELKRGKPPSSSSSQPIDNTFDSNNTNVFFLHDEELQQQQLETMDLNAYVQSIYSSDESTQNDQSTRMESPSSVTSPYFNLLPLLPPASTEMIELKECPETIILDKNQMSDETQHLKNNIVVDFLNDFEKQCEKEYKSIDFTDMEEMYGNFTLEENLFTTD